MDYLAGGQAITVVVQVWSWVGWCNGYFVRSGSHGVRIVIAVIWSAWFPLDPQTIATKAPPRPGSYKISCGKRIERLVGEDEDGVLMIGESSDLQYRIGQFHRTVLDPKTSSHSEGNTFYNLAMREHFPISTLRFRFAVTESKREARALEEKELNDYENVHLELPPLNTARQHERKETRKPR